MAGAAAVAVGCHHRHLVTAAELRFEAQQPGGGAAVIVGKKNPHGQTGEDRRILPRRFEEFVATARER